jgi:hypothetical protein
MLPASAGSPSLLRCSFRIPDIHPELSAFFDFVAGQWVFVPFSPAKHQIQVHNLAVSILR